MNKLARHSWLMGILSAGLLLLAFPIAGPTPFWRTFFSWIAFVPLLWALLSPGNLARPRAFLHGTLIAYAMGVLWFAGNCYWIYQTMLYYGGLPPSISAAILALYSLILGLYFAAFGFSITLIGRHFRPLAALIAAPFLWVAIELLSARFTKVPWDLLGYSQIDNFLLDKLAPWAGVYGLSFVLMAANALLAYGALQATGRRRFSILAGALILVLILQNGDRLVPPLAPVQSTAVLVQPNLNVDQDNSWPDSQDYEQHVDQLIRLSEHTCGPYLAGMPELNAYPVIPDCAPGSPPPGIVAWPESPGPFYDKDQRLLRALATVAAAERAPVVAGVTAIDPHGLSEDRYNSALFVRPDGTVLGRYDKVHLVPWGEYVPFKDFFAFAKNLTQQAGDMTHGSRRMVFTVGGHTFGIFICYEEIFGDEVRIFVKNGAQVLLNISDDGWYGDTCAPWQTLNMSRMRAVENRRWVLRDTNTGLTTAVDPYGRLTASVGRHALTSLAAAYGYRSDLTFYTRYGDVFAKLCGIISIAIVAIALRKSFPWRPASPGSSSGPSSQD
ncbi:MAG TPA: apolipoprotein N-acyltransferase [Acidobacteriaceae bacterium]|nr:apolipoprotein N-acyltransferase [Acidobacteriaceae bacterium]